MTGLKGCALRGSAPRGILYIIQKDHVVGKDDHLPGGRFGGKALGYLVPPFVVERAYWIVEYEGGTVGRCRQLREESRNCDAGLLSLAQNLSNLGIRLGKQANLILRQAVLSSCPDHLHSDIVAY